MYNTEGIKKIKKHTHQYKQQQPDDLKVLHLSKLYHLLPLQKLVVHGRTPLRGAPHVSINSGFLYEKRNGDSYSSEICFLHCSLNLRF